MCVEVFRITNQSAWVYNVDKRFCGEVSCAFAFRCGEGTFGLVVLAEF